MYRYLYFGLFILFLGIYACQCEESGINVIDFNASEEIIYTTYQNETPGQFNTSGKDLQKIINTRIEPELVRLDAEERIDQSGERTIKQVCDIYDNLTKNWKFVSDMRGGESFGDYFQYANHSIKLSKNGYTGGGDCDDYSILMASMLDSIGMTPRIVLAYGPNESHAYPEVYLGNSIKNENDINKIKKWIQIKYNLANLTDVHTNKNLTSNDVWLNLDWGGTPYASNDRHPGYKYFRGSYENMVIFVKPTSSKTNLNPAPLSLFSIEPKREINVTETLIFDAYLCEEVDSIEKYNWVFGDGTNISDAPEKARRVVHRFNSSGIIKVSLTVKNKKGISIINSTDIIVRGGPLQENRPNIRLFVATPEMIFPEETVTIEWIVENATNVTIDPGNRIVPSKGTLREKLVNTTEYIIKAVNHEGLSDVRNVKVLVVKRPMIIYKPMAAFFYSPSVPMQNETVMFDGSLSAGNISVYEWNLGDGAIKEGKTIDHSYTQSGTYPVTLMVIDENNFRDYSDRQYLKVSSSSPTALFSIQPDRPKIGDLIKFDASSSRAPANGNIVSYIWDYGDNTPKGNGMIVTHIFNKSGAYPVTLMVIDQKGLKDDEIKDISVADIPPIPLFSVMPDEPKVGSVVSFDASLSKSEIRKIIQYKWNFGDNRPEEDGIFVNHIFQKSGNYLVNLKVIDEENVIGNCSKWIKVSQDIPTEPSTVLKIESFTFTPNPVCYGDATKISWKTSGATGVTITPGIGIVEPSGFRILSPKQSMGYTIRAWNTTMNTKPITVLLGVEHCIEDLTPSQSQTENVVYDFIDEAYDQGQWQAGPPDAIFLFGGRSEDDYRGSAMWKNDLQLNDKTVIARALQVVPPENGYVSGIYRHMNYVIQRSDRLIGRVGFMNGSEAGNVTFSLFLIEGNVYHHLWSRSLSYEGGSVGFDIPLGSYVDWQPAICLKVDSNGESLQDNAVWQDVKIIGMQRPHSASENRAQNDFAASIFDNIESNDKWSGSSGYLESSAADWLNKN